ncbi:MAG: ABC transporter permease [Spirochaetales bacterium]|nr:ABC transporter permease [Spirochaetales bacterium]
MLIFKIAWRNILRHKGKSFIIGGILFLGAFLMVLGNATSNGMNRGIEENMVKSFTGHILLISDKEEDKKFLFPMLPKPMKIIQDYDRIQTILKQQDYIKDFLPMTRGGLAILGEAQMSFLMTYGCNFDDFQRVFGSPYEAVEGDLLKNGDKGILINSNGRKKQHVFQGFWLVPEGRDVVEANLSDEAKKEYPDLAIRRELNVGAFGESNASDDTVPVRAIVKFKSLNGLMEDISIIDIETYRKLFGYFTAEDIAEEVPVAQQKLLAAGEDDLFGSGDIFATGATTSVAELEKTIKTKTVIKRVINYDDAAFNYISLVLNPGESIDGAMAKIENLIEAEGLQLQAVSWRTASGQIADLSDVASGIINVFVFLLFIVAIIIIANTLSMTAMERTEEFGMMRAVGARKGFIAKMFLSETFFLSFIFGGIGLFAGVIVTWIIRPIGIGAGGIDFIELVFGGETFRPMLGFAGLVNGIINLLFVTIFAVIYPLLVARKITPLDAINRQ